MLSYIVLDLKSNQNEFLPLVKFSCKIVLS